MNSPLTRTTVGGLPITSTTPTGATEIVLHAAEQRAHGDVPGLAIHLVNAYTVALASKSETYRSIFKHPAVNLPDGKPLAWVGRRISPQIRQVRGPSLMEDVFKKSQDRNIRHFLLGSSPETLERLEKSLRERYPHANIVGRISPPYRTMTNEELEEQDQTILATKANIVWVGLGTPKQDIEVSRIAKSLNVVAMAVGAAFDFSAGTKKHAPRIFTVLYLEWLYRFASEPRRLWKRYTIGNLRFIRMVGKDLLMARVK